MSVTNQKNLQIISILVTTYNFLYDFSYGPIWPLFFEYVTNQEAHRLSCIFYDYVFIVYHKIQKNPQNPQ